MLLMYILAVAFFVYILLLLINSFELITIIMFTVSIGVGLYNIHIVVEQKKEIINLKQTIEKNLQYKQKVE